VKRLFSGIACSAFCCQGHPVWRRGGAGATRHSCRLSAIAHPATVTHAATVAHATAVAHAVTAVAHAVFGITTPVTHAVFRIATPIAHAVAVTHTVAITHTVAVAHAIARPSPGRRHRRFGHRLWRLHFRLVCLFGPAHDDPLLIVDPQQPGLCKPQRD